MSAILVAGVAVLDFVFHTENFPRVAEKYRADGAAISGGGNAANAAVAIARLGGGTELAARLGVDQIADMIVSDLEKENVGTALIKQYPGCRSSFSSIYIDGEGERQIMNYRDNQLPWDADWIATSAPDNMVAALADTRWPDGALAAMQCANVRGVPGIMDAEAPVLEAEQAVHAASHVAFSAQGAVDFTGQQNIDEAALRAAEILPGKVIVTDGENGVVMVQDQVARRFPAFEIDPVDTLGAGDIWHGAFALALGEGMSEEMAIPFASAAAAIKCSRTGGREGAPSRQEVLQFLKERT